MNKLRVALFRTTTVLLILALTACSAPPPELASTPWRGALELPGGELPFTIRFKDTAAGLSAVIENGAERLEVPRVQLDGDRLELEFPAFNNRIALTREGDTWRGDLTLIKRGGKRQVMPLVLSAGQTHRFFEGEQDVNADFGGRWAVEFQDDDGKTTQAVGEFEQLNGKVTGTFRTPTGDYRYLAGDVRDDLLYLSTFDGAHAFLFVARQGENGRITGDFWSGTKWHETFTATRNATVELPDANALSKIRAGVERINFSFPDTAGDMVSLDDARFSGKVVVLALAGSWCPNCHDEAAFLSPFHKARADDGLEVVGLMFEHLDEFNAAAVQVNAFRDKFDIDYPLVVAGFSDKKQATESLGLLDEVIAYPTMIVLDRNRAVRLVHTGFNGPGTGVHYDEFRASFGALIDELLQEDPA
ncbi:MAG: TlpA disulfide reductase family protein [Pseudomonadota bacterium]